MNHKTMCHSKLNDSLITDFKKGLVAIDYRTIKDSSKLLSIFRAALPNNNFHYTDANYFLMPKGFLKNVVGFDIMKNKKLVTVNDF